MRLIITILFLYCFDANAINYYISNTGSDAAAGTSTGAAWQTISKINSSSFNPGDSIFFKKGDSWNERLNFPSSGSVGNVIYVGSYGTGNKPIITGLQQATGFTNVGSVWTASIPSSVKKLNTVIVNGTLKAKARTPNSTYYTFTSVNSFTQISTSLTGVPDYTGSEIVVRHANWIIDVSKVSSQSVGVLNLRDALTYNTAYGGTGFFFQNNIADLDTEGEWVFDSTAKTLKVFAATSPTVYFSTIDTLVHSRSKSYLTFNGLSFTGANKAALQLDTANYVTIQNCSINNSGTLGISALKSNKLSVLNDSIQNTLSGAVYARQVDPFTPMVNTCDSSIIDGNYIKNTGIYPGMGMNNNGRYTTIFAIGLRTIITNNVIDSSGYIAIQFNGKNSYIYRNYVTTHCLIKNDGGAIYTVVGAYMDADYTDGSVIRSNITVNGVGGTNGATDAPAAGIMLDDQARNVTVDSNTVYNSTYMGIFLHNVGNDTVRNNTVVNSMGAGMFLNGVVGANFRLSKNIVYMPVSNKEIFTIVNGTTVTGMDSNYYSRPSNETTAYSRNSTTYNLAGWRTITGQDANTVGTPSGVTSDPALFYYNPTASDSTISFSGIYKDAKSNLFNNSVTLTPFTSVVLFAVAPRTKTIRYFKGRVI